MVPALLAVAEGRPENMAFDDDEDWDPWWDMQLKAIERLGRLEREEAIPILARILDDEEGQDIESEVLTALAGIGAAAEPVLAQRMENPNAHARRRAVYALGRMRSESSLRTIGQALKDPSSDVRVAALEAFGKRKAAGYLRAVLLFCKDPEAEVRAAAMQAVGGILGPRETSDDSAQGAQGQIDTIDIVGLLANPDPDIRTMALTALSKTDFVPDTTTRKVINAALASPNPGIAGAACALLGQIVEQGHQEIQDTWKDPSVRAILIEIIGDSGRETSVRKEAILALGRSKEWDQDSAAVLSRAVVDPDQSIRFAALHVLMALVDANTGTEREDVDLEDPRSSVPFSPLDVVIDALGGKLLVADEQKADSDQDASPEDATNTPSLSTDAQDSNEQEVDAQGDPESALITSTLQAIAKDNLAAAREFGDRGEEGSPTESAVSDNDTAGGSELDHEVQVHLAAVRKRQADTAWLFQRGSVSVADDARRLAARILSGTDDRNAVMALVEAPDDPETELVRASALALAVIANRDRSRWDVPSRREGGVHPVEKNRAPQQN